ncbi:MAG TPA: cyanophycinase [Herpetosiphonaceae bacterium]|nr:cyanophycinase [Herpetosiphonaceae bacterium]
MKKGPAGTLIIIGGHEDKQSEREILKAVAERVAGGKLVIATVATSLPEETAEEYVKVFQELGVKQIDVLDIRNRAQAYDPASVDKLEEAAAIFFTGGDQLRITAHLGDSQVYTRLQEIYLAGGTIIGTSAGASVMSETMMVSGAQDQSHMIGDLTMAPGFGFLKGVIVDQHFAERGRIGRLIAAVAHNPRNIGIGIDENTAIMVDQDKCVTVIGEGAIYVVDGTGISDTNLAEGSQNEVLSCFDIRLHVLKAGQQYDLNQRRPYKAQGELVMPVPTPGGDSLGVETERRAMARDGDGKK